MISFLIVAVLAVDPSEISSSSGLATPGAAPTRLHLTETPSGFSVEVAPTPGVKLNSNQMLARLDELRMARPNLGGPIAMTAVGGGLALVGGYTYLMYSPFTSFGGFLSTELSPIVTASVVFASVGVGALVLGLVWLADVIKERAHIDQEVVQLRSGLRDLGITPPNGYTPTVTHSASVSLNF